MSIIQILIFFGIIIGIVFFGWIIIAALFLLYSWIEKKMLRKRISETIKADNEKARLKRGERKGEYKQMYNLSPKLKQPLENVNTQIIELPEDVKIVNEPKRTERKRLRRI